MPHSTWSSLSPSQKAEKEVTVWSFWLLSAMACSAMQPALADRLVKRIRNVKITFCSTAGLPVICFSLSQAAAGYTVLCSFNCHSLPILFSNPQFKCILHLQDGQTTLTWSFLPCAPIFTTGYLEMCPIPPSSPRSSLYFAKRGSCSKK